jgi:hypothetical protein
MLIDRPEAGIRGYSNVPYTIAQLSYNGAGVSLPETVDAPANTADRGLVNAVQHRE